tara:strand:- start:739 stop:939 length:201 start_codon:yes stop_codon:yes gene_type:complete
VYRLVGYFDQSKHEEFSNDKSVIRTYIPNHADDIVAVTDEQYVVLKLKYPDIETLGFYSFPLDYFN